MRGLAATLGTLTWLLAGSGSAAEPLERLTADDVFELAYLSDPRVAPGGGAVVYVRESPDVATDSWYSSLELVDAAGGAPRALTEGRHQDTSPRWSPDGRRLAFLSDRDGTTQIYVLDLAGGAPTRLTDLGQEPGGLAWSPDGRSIAFTARESAPPPAVAELPRPPPGASWAEPPRIEDRLVYRADGVGYLDHGVLRLYVVPADGGQPRRVTRDASPLHETSLDPLNLERDDAAPSWTPDGRYLVVSANRRPDWELHPLDTELFEVSVEGGTMRPLTARRGPDASPAVSPDGRFVAYVGYDEQRKGYQLQRLYLLARAGGAPRALTAGFDRSVRAPRWTGDGQGLLVTYHDRGNTRVAHVDLEGRVRELSGDVGSGYSAYGGGTFTLAEGGVYAFTYSRPQVPVEVALGRVGTPGVRVLTALNEGLLAAKELGAVEEVWFPSRRDGRPIQGWVVLPPGFDPARPPPLVLDVHGGPFRDFGDRFDVDKQLLAAHGYAVLYVNPRGSAGYGEAFGNLIHHAYPGDEVHDFDAAVAAAVDRGWADPENLFITGGSGGALLALWTIAQRPSYRAAVAAYPVVDWASFVLTTDVAAWVIDDWFPGPPWEHPEHYRARSPLWRVADLATPTMVVVGEEDYRTTAAQGEQIYSALKLRSVDALLVRLPGEPHYGERHPSHQIARMLLTIGWFDRYRSGVDAAGDAGSR